MSTSTLLLIKVPPKIWQPKVVNQFRMPSYDDVDDGIFEFKAFGNCVLRNDSQWSSGERTDVIQFDDSKDILELEKDLKFQ